MFRRKRNSSHSPINSNPSPSAQTAAAQAFRSSQSSTNLSSSAAAAALRTHASTPTSVKDVQTKRMVRRQLSSSSIGSSKGSVRRDNRDGGLQRSYSSGSMTSRTFRDQHSNCASPVPRPDEIIPVPPLPQNYAASRGRRTVSLEPTYRAISPPSKRAGSNQTPSLDGFSELERHDSKGSINFSYPMGARPNSPRQSPVPGGLAEFPHSAPSSPHQAPRVASPPNGSNPVVQKRYSTDRPTTGKRQITAGSRGATPEGSRTSAPADTSPDATLGVVKTNKEPVSNTNKSAPANKQTHTVKRMPSTIPEIQEDDYQDRANCSSENVSKPQSGDKSSTIKESPVPKQSYKVKPPQKTTDSRDTRGFIKLRRPPQGETQSATHSPIDSASPVIPNARPHSLSPNRLTRFSGHLEIPGPGEYLHNPPPRSMSPAKSALKATATSQITHSDRQYRKPIDAPSETSDGTSIASEDGSRSGWKKKNTKVSFEDETEIIGHVQSPPTSPESSIPASPQSKGPAGAPWHGSINRNKSRKVEGGDGFEEVLAPRPILPSFGSIRGSKQFPKDAEIVTRSSDSSGTTSPTNLTAINHSFSVDGPIGGILSSSKFRKPIDQYPKRPNHPLQPEPPEVTSVNGTGYSSSSDDSSASEEGIDLRFFPPRIDKEHPDSRSKIVDTKVEAGQEQKNKQQNGLTPAIFVQPATPALEGADFEREITSPGPKELDTTNTGREEQNKPDTEPQRDMITAAGDKTHQPGSTEARDDSESDTGDSIYSDAVEDPSELEGDNFGSIDAIVDNAGSQAPERVNCDNHDRFKSDSTGEFGPESSVEESSHSRSRSWVQSQQLPYSLRPLPVQEQEQQPDTVQEKHTIQNPAPVAKTANLENTHVIPGRKQSTHGKKPEEPINQSIQSSREDSSRVLPTRTLSQGSDSSSSFKRAKPSRPLGHHFSKRTMRSAAGDAGGRFSDVGTQPGAPFDHTTQRRPFSSGGGTSTMRSTMRQGGNTNSKPSSFSGFGKFSKPKAVAGRNRSSGAGFRSRFDDSSDDEPETISLRPVRGIPRRKNEIDGDSTDLDDSSENEGRRSVLGRSRLSKKSTKTNKGPVIASAITDLKASKETGNTATASPDSVNKELEDFLPQYSEKPKRGFFNRLSLSRRSRRHDETRIRKLDLDSAARRDTPLERSRLELEHSRARHPPNNITTPSPATTVNNTAVTETAPNKWHKLSPKLQKRTKKPSSRSASDSWPLQANGVQSQQPDTIISNGKQPLSSGIQSNGNQNYRPHTSDGAVENGAPRTNSNVLESPSLTASGKPVWTSRFLPRHTRRETSYNNTFDSSASDIGPSMGTSVLKQREKQGKYPMLKKAFGLTPIS